MELREDGGQVLIPTGHEASTYTSLRSLARRDVGVVVASEKEQVPASASRFCDEVVSLPPPRRSVANYRDALLDIAGRADIRTVVPVRPIDSYVLSQYRNAFAERVPLFVPDRVTFDRINDRLRLAAEARGAGVPIPKTRSLDDVHDWSQRLVVKSRYNLLASEATEGLEPGRCDVVKEVRYLRPGCEPDTEEVVRTMGHVPIVQSFVPKDGEYVFGALYDRGEPLATFQHRQIRGDSYTGGGGVYRKSVSIPALDRVGRRLLDHLEWHGLACIEFMRHAETGEYMLTEVNPRIWQSLPVAVAAGADFPYAYWLAANGRAEEIDPSYEVGVGGHYLYGELAHLWSVVSEESPLVPQPSAVSTAAAILTSTILDPHFDYFRLDDPAPFLRGLINAVSTRLGRNSGPIDVQSGASDHGTHH